MKYPEYRYVDVAFGGADKRNRLVDIRQLKVPVNVPDCYRTVYRYPDAMREHFAEKRSVSGYTGPVYADWLPIDIDRDDVHEAHQDAKRFVEQIAIRYELSPDDLRCFFSGQKGFHILIPAEVVGWEPSVDLPRQFRRMALILADGIRIDTSIYDRVRLFRLSNTKHGKTGLYKIPLLARELLHLTTEQILELAKQPRKVEWGAPEPSETMRSAWGEACKEPEPQATASNGTPQPDRWMKPCIARMLQGGMRSGEGGRQPVALRLAVHFRKQGMSAAMALAALREWNRTNIDVLEDREIEHAVEQAYGHPEYDFGCNDPLHQQFCAGQCPFKRAGGHAEPEQDEQPIKVLDFQEAQQRYEEYIALLRTAKVTLGIPALDEAMRGVAPGETCWIIARAGVGKTAFLLNILAHNSDAGAESLFCTLEMPVAQIYERGVQIAAQASGRDVEQVFLKAVTARELGGNVPPEYHQWSKYALERFRLVRIADKDSMSVDDVRAALRAYEERYGHRPRILAIDYLGRMDGGYGSPYEVTSRLAKAVKSIAKEFNVAVIVLHQVSREGGEGDQEVTLHMARDSGVVEEAADFVIGLWRPEMRKAAVDGRAEEPVRAALLKCRRGPLKQTTFVFDKARMTFRALQVVKSA